MCDVQSVVAQLQQTPKGKLKYNAESWNAIFQETTKPPRLHVSPFVVRHISRVATCNDSNQAEQRKSINTPQVVKSQTPVSGKIPPLKYGPTITLSTQLVDNSKNQTPAHRVKSPERLTSPPISPEFLLNNVDKEYEEISKSFASLRLQNMRENINKIDEEFKHDIDLIEQHSMNTHYQKSSDVYHQERVPIQSEEIKKFVSIKKEREQKAIEQSKQTDLHLKAIDDKQRKLDEVKRAIKQKKLLIGKHGETIKPIFESVTNGYKQNKDLYTFPEEYKQLVNHVLNEHAQCTKIIAAAMENNAVDLDGKLQLVTQKTQLLLEYAKNCQDILNKLKAEKEAVEKKRLAEEEAKKKLEAEEAKKKAEAAKAEAAKAPIPTTVAPATTANISVSSIQQAVTQVPVPSIQEAAPELISLTSLLQEKLPLFSLKQAFSTYLILRKLLSDTETIHQPLSASKEKDKKAYKFDLYKVVNTQINAISDESPKHLMEKILKLNNLLTEGEVVFSGKKISARGNKEALGLVKDLTAKKLVLQGQKQVGSSFKSAFPLAAVCAGLWSLFPDVGDLILGHLYVICPYLVPIYFPKGDNMTTTEYCEIIGYEVDDGKVEDEDKYLSKLSGCVRLYAAIVQMEMPPDLAGRGHPHGLEHGWIWFTRILNLEPRPSVTATVIYDFLEVAGHAMMKKFGKQFQKLLLVLVQQMMPKIMNVTPPDSKAGAMRLKMFLEKCIKEGSIKSPDGMLTQRWWKTGHA